MIWHKRIWGRKRGEGEILIKTVFVGLLTFAFISVGLIMIGNVLEVKWLMFSFYKETSTGFEAGGSAVPFIIAFICSYFIGNYYENKKHGYRA